MFRLVLHDRHDSHGERTVRCRPFEKSGKVEPVRDAELCHAAYHMVHHVAAAGHNAAYLRDPFEYVGGGLHEVVGSFLVCHSAAERYDFVLLSALCPFVSLLASKYGFVHPAPAFGFDAVFRNS